MIIINSFWKLKTNFDNINCNKLLFYTAKIESNYVWNKICFKTIFVLNNGGFKTILFPTIFVLKQSFFH